MDTTQPAAGGPQRIDEHALERLLDAGASLRVPVPVWSERPNGDLELDLGPWGGVWEVPAEYRRQAGDLH